MDDELIYQIAITKIAGIGDVHTKALVNLFGSAAEVFRCPLSKLEKVEGIGRIKALAIKSFKDFKSCETEIKFIEKHSIQAYFFTNQSYPKRLQHCYDAPALLYFKGKANLNKAKIISIAGTRNNSCYGKEICERFIEELNSIDVIIVSGLAYGIDTIAHQTAIKNNMATIGVLAHGLDRIYPAINKALAKEMINNGGLLTSFTSTTKPDKHNFPNRNRITAGICDALVIIETGNRGGSLITAELANGYHKVVFAFPGRVSDIKSEGCNLLVQKNKACLIQNSKDLLDYMQWTENKKARVSIQRELFNSLTTEELIVFELLKKHKTLDIDNIFIKTNLHNSKIATALLMLEMQGLIKSLPGKVFSILN